MARVTVEDCIEKVDNRFELVMLASKRARTISGGGAITVDRDNDKNAVVSLREIADETIATHDLREQFIKSMQKYVEIDELEDTPDFGDDVIARDNNFNDANLPHNQIKPDPNFLSSNSPMFGSQAQIDDEEVDVDETFARAQKQGFGGMSFDDIMDAKD